jgi:leader peptidase (prepilin peptidase)/N-methyltransferase
MIEATLRIAFAAVLGACFGSFANVLAIRLHEESSLLGRSRCPACDTPIRPRHLVPLLSWLALRGACADCGAQIHVQYPIVELVAMCLAVIAAVRFDPFSSPMFYAEMLLSVALVVFAVMDLRWKELPLELMVLVGLVAVVARLGYAIPHGLVLSELTSLGLAFALGIGFFGLQWLVSKGNWLGSGDIWFAAMMAAVLAWPGTVVGIYLAYLVGGLVVLLLMLLGYIRRGMRVPFAPALAAGLLLTLWFGDRITDWVLYALT